MGYGSVMPKLVRMQGFGGTMSEEKQTSFVSWWSTGDVIEGGDIAKEVWLYL